MPRKSLTPAQLRKAARERFLKARKAEVSFQRQLVQVAKQVGTLIKGYAPDGIIEDMEGLRTALNRYAELIRPWARRVAARMHAEVGRRDVASWEEYAQTIGKSLRQEILRAPTGRMLTTAMNEQVKLITSLPLEAAERVHKIAREGLFAGRRADELQAEIMKSGHVTVGRAKLIARTETSRTASLLVESRARFIGSTHYIWRTSRDWDVRLDHRKLEGKIIPWDDPPIAGPNNMRYHPGAGPNCRCWPEPVIPKDL